MAALMMLAAASLLLQAQTSRNLLTNPGFERTSENIAADWRPYETGYTLASDVRRSGSYSIRCENASPNERRGATYELTLNQKEPAPILVSGWSRAENVQGSRAIDYAIYLDILYTDGTPLWGQTATFRTGTHDWERRQVLVVPTKPIRTVFIHALFRLKTGTVWFDDFEARELTGDNVFDGQPLAPPRLAAGQRAGWFVRDVAAGSPIVDARQAGRLKLTLRTDPDAASFRRATVVDEAGRDRAITLYYVERVAGPGATWWRNIRAHQTAGQQELTNLEQIHVGATGLISPYPLACVTTPREGRALGVHPDQGPCVLRFGYHPASGLLYAAADFALTPKNQLNRVDARRGKASLRLVAFAVDRRWGFRSAAERYYALFPTHYGRRATAEGIWIPFTDPALVQGLEDFGIAYHEGDNSVESDDKLGILSFRYTEPMTYWMPMPKETPRTYEAALALIREHAAGQDESKKRWAQTVLNSCGQDEEGRFNVEFVAAPWSDGATWVLNANPALPAGPDAWTKATHSYTPEMADRMYGPAARGVQDGEYLDSIEGWSQWLDYRPESLRYSSYPLTFDTDTHRPVVPTWFSTCELTRFMSQDLRRRGKLLMANATPLRLHCFAPLLDVMGCERNWLPGGTWQPDSDDYFCLVRTLSNRKPYLLLQNTDFDAFAPYVERYFARCMFYAVYPSFFSIDAANNPYWMAPRWYNRDRPLFRKYIPVIKKLSAEGWQPVTHASSSNPRVFLERYGTRHLTVMNDSRERQQARLVLDLRQLGLASARIRDVLSGETVGTTTASETILLTLGPEEVRVLELIPVSR